MVLKSRLSERDRSCGCEFAAEEVEASVGRCVVELDLTALALL